MNLILIRGVSGSGKTSLALLFPNSFIAEADNFFMTPDGSYDFDYSRIADAHRVCKLDAMEALKSGKFLNVVVSNTSTRESDVKYYKELAKEYGATFFSLVVEKRHGGKDHHGVPEKVKVNQEALLRGSIKLA